LEKVRSERLSFKKEVWGSQVTMTSHLSVGFPIKSLNSMSIKMETKNAKSIFDPYHLNGFQLNNSMVMAPMTRSRAIGSMPNPLMSEYYRQRSSAGLIITEGTSPSRDGLGYARTPGIFSQEQITAWKDVTDAVHSGGGRIFIQLMHVGRIANSLNMPSGARILAPSAIAPDGTIWTDSQGMQPKGTPQEMTPKDIRNTINDFAKAAENAITAGFDGVELHGANGYLLEQFLSPHANKRNDEFGGSLENRARFVLDVAKAVAGAIGKEKTGMRISPYSTFNDMPLYNEIFETYSYLSKELSALGLVYLHVVDYAARTTTEGLELLKEVRKNFGQTLILNGGYTKAKADHAIAHEGADLVSFGSSFLANPDLPYRLKHDLELNVPDGNTFYTPDATGYTDYPTL
jgi:N-ethylmaleimide reductase